MDTLFPRLFGKCFHQRSVAHKKQFQVLNGTGGLGQSVEQNVVPFHGRQRPHRDYYKRVFFKAQRAPSPVAPCLVMANKAA
jgi:hypothetical protein